MFSSVAVFGSECLNVAGDSATQNATPVQLKEEEDEAEKQPAAKRKRAQSKSQAKTEKMPKEEIKSDGKVEFIITYVVYATIAR